ncbi:hypothetical protein EON64_11320, partial [archaeon]
MIANFIIGLCLLCFVGFAASKGSCQFANSYECSDFKSEKIARDYLHRVMKWEGQFAKPNVGYDPVSGYTYDGHPIDYNTGELYGEPHLFSAPSKESIHVALLALAIDGNEYAQEFAGGVDAALEVLQLKMQGYMQFNATYPGFGCFTPWVGFPKDQQGFHPMDSWSNPYYKVPGLDNGEWFWSLYAAADVLGRKYANTHGPLAEQYRAFVQCQKDSAKTIFYRGNGDVSATVYILDVKKTPIEGGTSNYQHCDGYLNDPYEGETLTQMLYLFSPWDSQQEREVLWSKKRGLFQKVD